jgi:ribosomal protein S27AE
MADVVPFGKAAGKKLKDKARARTMCGSGFHKWEIDQKKQFDVKRGKLVTLRRCVRCGETKVDLT